MPIRLVHGMSSAVKYRLCERLRGRVIPISGLVRRYMLATSKSTLQPVIAGRASRSQVAETSTPSSTNLICRPTTCARWSIILSSSGARRANSTDAATKETKTTEPAGTKKSKKSKKPKKAKIPRGKLTEKQKATKQAKKLREMKRELKDKSLQPPKKLPVTAFVVAFMEKYPDILKTAPDARAAFKEATAATKAAMSTPEWEQYESRAQTNRVSNSAAYDAWIKSWTPLQIKEANLARTRYSRLTGKPVRLLRDDRLVKRPITAFVYYFKEQKAQEPSTGLSNTEFVSSIARDWKQLSESEKEKYYRMQAEDLARYKREYESVYGMPPPASQTETKMQS